MTLFKSILISGRGASDPDPTDDPAVLLRRAFRKPFFRRLLPPYTGSSADTVFGIGYYGHRAYDTFWFKLTIGVIHGLLQKVDDAYYWLHYRTDGRYHVVPTGLRPGYYDVDQRMFEACFALLGFFVERELGPATVDEEFMHRGYRVHSGGGTDERAIDLWLWYRFELPQQIAAYEDDLYGRYGATAKHTIDGVSEDGTDFLAETQSRGGGQPSYNPFYPEQLKNEKLAELIALREKLWT